MIHEGLKDKKRKIEAEQADRIMKLALDLDPPKEISKRFNSMKRAIEESSEVLDSARSITQSGAPSESMSKKKVQFA